MVFQGVARQMKLQYAMRKHYVWLAGMGAFFFSADHLILQRSEAKLRTLGLIHQGNMQAQFSQMAFSNSLEDRH